MGVGLIGQYCNCEQRGLGIILAEYLSQHIHYVFCTSFVSILFCTLAIILFYSHICYYSVAQKKKIEQQFLPARSMNHIIELWLEERDHCCTYVANFLS